MNHMAKSGGGNSDPVFWEKARAHLVRYGGNFAPFIAERAQGRKAHDDVAELTEVDDENVARVKGHFKCLSKKSAVA